MSRKAPFDDPAFRRYAKHFFAEVAPKISGSGHMMVIAPLRADTDVKIATELGYSILLDKPLVVIVPAGRREHIAPKLLRIADHVVEGDMSTEAGREALQLKLTAVLKQ
jgi:hypothetical protein